MIHLNCIQIGSTPPEEDCAQVGAPDYTERVTEEANRYIELIRQKFGKEPDGAKLAVQPNCHDFGTYHQVVCYFELDNLDAERYALACEWYGPTDWNDDERDDWRQYEFDMEEETS